jgi:hypothetical protein
MIEILGNILVCLQVEEVVLFSKIWHEDGKLAHATLHISQGLQTSFQQIAESYCYILVVCP